MDSPTTTSVEHYGPAAVRLAFERGTDGPRTIVVGVDGGRTSDRACAYAVGLARRQCCRLVIVFVAAPSPLVGLSGAIAGAAVLALDELAGQLRRDARRLAEEAAVPTTFICRRGQPYLELRKAADELTADIVVVGASTHTGVRFAWSLAGRLIRLGRWPVVVVP